MDADKALRWRAKASVVYAVGVWTMIGTFAYLKYTGRLDPTENPPPPQKKEEEEEDENTTVYRSDHLETKIVYKKDFVPYGVRFMNFFTGSSAGADPGVRGEDLTEKID